MMHKTKQISVVLIACLASSIGACSLTVPTPSYAPITTAELTGSVEVKPFRYAPNYPAAPDVVRNTGAGTLKLSEPVAGYVTGAVSREFRQAGLSVKPGGPCWVDGEITDLTIDDVGLGRDVTYLTDIRYVLHDRADQVLLDKPVHHQLSTAKMLEPSALATFVAQVVAGNIAKLMDDSAFRGALASACNGR